MKPRALRRSQTAYFASLLAGSALAFTPVRASAQTTPTTTIATTAVVKQVSPSKGDAKTHDPSTLAGFKINHQDCLDDNYLRVTPVFTGVPSTLVFEVWASTGSADCTVSTNRVPNGTCWKVYATNPTTQSESIDIRVRDIVVYRAGVATTASSLNAGIEACDPKDGESRGETKITLNFYWMNGATVANSATYTTSVDLFGPAPPSGASVGIDDTRLVAKWNASSDLDTTGYRIYCKQVDSCGGDPGTVSAPSTTTDASAASVADDAGDAAAFDTDSGVVDDAGGTTATGDDAGTSLGLSTDSEFLCGTISDKTTSELTISTLPGGARLVNGQYYAFGVTGVDRYGNAGELSTVACGSPSATTDFWKTYREAGGAAGGGYCNYGVRSNAADPSLLVLGTLLGLVVISVRKKGRR